MHYAGKMHHRQMVTTDCHNDACLLSSGLKAKMPTVLQRTASMLAGNTLVIATVNMLFTASQESLKDTQPLSMHSDQHSAC